MGNIQPAKANDIKEIDQRLGAFNQAKLSFAGKPEQPIAYVIKNEDEIIAGISACIDWGYILHIDLLFVDEKYRHQGLGSLLLRRVEKEAMALGAEMPKPIPLIFRPKIFTKSLVMKFLVWSMTAPAQGISGFI